MFPIAEVPGVIAMWSDPSNYGLRPQAQAGGTYRLVVVHITSGRPVAQNTASMWQQPNKKSSAHFVIGQDATIVQCVPLKFAAWHAHQANAYSVGVEHCAREPNEPSFPAGDPGLPLSPEQRQKSAWLVAYLLKAAGLPVDRQHVMGHNEADPATTHTLCPTGVAGGWDWPSYMTMVQAAYDQIGEPPALV